MKIPDSIRIAGVEYKVVFVGSLNNGVNLAYGQIDYENSVIRLSSTVGTEHQKRCKTLWHEILHGIVENSGMEIDNEEAVVDMFSKGIYQVLQDNGARLFDLSTDEPEKKECPTCVHFVSCEPHSSICGVYEENEDDGTTV